MSFTLRGVLTASVCEDCLISLAGATVRVYATVPDQGVTARAAADPRHTFRLFHHASAEDQAALDTAHGELLGEAVIGADGSYAIELAPSYVGDAVDVDVYCGTLAGHVPPRPTQVTLTTLQPTCRRPICWPCSRVCRRIRPTSPTATPRSSPPIGLRASCSVSSAAPTLPTLPIPGPAT